MAEGILQNFKPCPECGAERIIAKVMNGQGGFSLITPHGNIWHGPQRAALKDWALVCTYCGHLALFVKKERNTISVSTPQLRRFLHGLRRCTRRTD